jgi:hypothetical protein
MVKLPDDAPWYDKMVFEIFSNPGYYFGYLAIFMIPLFLVAMVATFVLISDSLNKTDKTTGKKKM